MNKSYLAPAFVLGFYAVVLVSAGLIAYFSAPAGAQAASAIIVPGAAAVLVWIAGVVTMIGVRRSRVGRVGFWAGVVLSALFVILFALPAESRSRQLANFPAAREAWAEALSTGSVKDDPSEKRAFFKARQSPTHDTTYLVKTFWTLTGSSVLAFAALLGVRPRTGADDARAIHPNTSA
jgi:hypothetical protein